MSDSVEVDDLVTPAPSGVALAPNVIAVIGCDGSGKSTLSRWLAEELGRHRASQFVYFGTGDGPGSRLITTLNWLKQRSRFNKKTPAPESVPDKQANSGESAQAGSVAMLAKKKQKGKAPTILRLVWAAAALSDRKGKMRELDRCVSSGMVVVTDRYPQAEFWGVHDGPRLGYLLEAKSSGLLYRIAQWEQSAYLAMVQRKPDLVILLDVSVEVAHARRPEEPLDELERRIKVARSLRFQNAVRVVLDASEPLEIVQQKALKVALNTEAADSVHDSGTKHKNADSDDGLTNSDGSNVNVRSM
ncbi:MAG: hypothetical protein AB8B64_22465 [Granulosicoccus sp.]